MSERGYIDAAPGRRTAAGALLVGGYNPTKLWVGGLPDTATLADLEDCFGQIGPCSCNIKRGFGFVVSFRNFYLLTLLSFGLQDSLSLLTEARIRSPVAVSLNPSLQSN